MTKEEKQLLIRDLCMRLPYNIVCKDIYGNCGTLVDLVIPLDCATFQCSDKTTFTTDIDKIIPYLRPMSSMTELEIHDFKATTGVFTYYPGHKMYDYIPMFDNDNTPFSTFDDDKVYYQVKPENIISCINWLNSHHFDYQKLIEKGLALKAPKGMYKIQ